MRAICLGYGSDGSSLSHVGTLTMNYLRATGNLHAATGIVMSRAVPYFRSVAYRFRKKNETSGVLPTSSQHLVKIHSK